MLTPNTENTFYLVNAKYIEENKQVVLTFANKTDKIIQRHSFFPYLFLPKFVEINTINKILRSFNLSKFKIIQQHDSIKLISSDYSNLKKAFNALVHSINAIPSLIQPERQFLIEKNYSYFNAFHLILNDLIKVNEMPSFEFIEFFLSNLHISIENKSFNDFLDKIALSILLVMPFNSVPESKHLFSEFFLEKILFASGLAVHSKKHSLRKKFNFSLLKRFKENKLLEINLNFFWLHLLKSINFFDLNCNCCKTDSFNETNINKNSLLEVEFKENAFYFLPINELFGLKFHSKKNNKNARISLMNEFFLQSIPVGPFHEKQKEFLELEDALTLVKNNKASLTGNSMLSWHCLKRKNHLMLYLDDITNYLFQLKESYNKSFNSFNQILKNEKTNYFTGSFIKHLEFFLNSISITSVFNEEQFSAFNSLRFYYLNNLIKTIESNKDKILFFDEKRIIFSSDNTFKLLKAISDSFKFNFSKTSRFIDSIRLKQLVRA